MTSLRYVSDDQPGIRRRRAGAGFVYVDADGRRVRDPATLDRIRAIVIPPAWKDVWICPSPEGHIQAIGRDARGRKQYRYHAAWTAARDEAKFDRMLAFAEALPAIRRQTALDLKRPPLSRERVLATVVRLLERTLIRIGNDEYARQNHSYGLTTLQNRHVRVKGSHVTFEFRAKSGIYQHVDLKDPQLARSVKLCQELPGQKLFEYVDSDKQLQTVDSSDVNEYLRQIAGEDFTAKDFRTWAGTVLAACALCAVARERPDVRSKTGRNKQIVAAIDRVAKALGNTRSVCRKCYVHPAILDSYLGGVTIDLAPNVDANSGLSRVLGDRRVERGVLALLKQTRKAGSRHQRSSAVRGVVGSEYKSGPARPTATRASSGRPLARQQSEGTAVWRQQLSDSPSLHSRSSTRTVRESKRKSGPRRATKPRNIVVRAS
jgi:DNA topoisomerase I